METLIRQIARTIEETGTGDKSDAAGKALKEMAFSGLSRSGFFKEFPYLPELETQNGQDLFVCFLNTGPENGIRIDEYIRAVRDELSALGTDTDPRKTDNGFEIETSAGSEEARVRLFISIFSKKTKEPQVKISFVHAPLAYELRSVDDLTDGVRSDLQSKLKAIIKAESGKNKKVPKKARIEKKAPQEQKDTWIQPSLFDF